MGTQAEGRPCTNCEPKVRMTDDDPSHRGVGEETETPEDCAGNLVRIRQKTGY